MAKLTSIVRNFGRLTSSRGVTGALGLLGTQGIVGPIHGTLLTNSQTGSYNLVAADVGKVITGVSTVNIVSGTFVAGDQVSIANTLSSGSINIKSGVGVTMYQSGVGIKTSLNVPKKSFASLLCVSTNVFAVTGYEEIYSATGGDLANALVPGNGYKYHTFSSPGTFVVNSGPIPVEILVVGGGGGGGPSYGGGGGAGGLVYGPSITLNPGTYPVTVGGGGGAQTAGTASSFGAGTPSPIVALGGGAGGVAEASAPGNGGSGGGAGGSSSTVFIGSPGTQPTQPNPIAVLQYGNPGGNQFGGANIGAAGGGGGAGSAGQAGPAPGAGPGGVGGNGRQYSQFSGPLIGAPSLNPLNGYFAGGGGGGIVGPPLGPTAPGGAGGLGGGGNGGKDPTGAGTPGAQYSGGGGGGGGYPPVAGLPGGSGIVIIRYPA